MNINGNEITVTEGSLTNALFNCSTLEASGSFTKAEAWQAARVMLAAPNLLALAARGASLADAVAESAYDVGKHTEDIRRLAYWALDARSAIRAAEGEG